MNYILKQYDNLNTHKPLGRALSDLYRHTCRSRSAVHRRADGGGRSSPWRRTGASCPVSPENAGSHRSPSWWGEGAPRTSRDDRSMSCSRGRSCPDRRVRRGCREGNADSRRGHPDASNGGCRFADSSPGIHRAGAGFRTRMPGAADAHGACLGRRSGSRHRGRPGASCCRSPM